MRVDALGESFRLIAAGGLVDPELCTNQSDGEMLQHKYTSHRLSPTDYPTIICFFILGVSFPTCDY